MKITKIHKLNGGKYKIEFDTHEKLTTYDEVILKNNLLYEKEIDSLLFHQLQMDTNYYDIYNRAMKYIMTKMRSVKEMYAYLDKNQIPIDKQEQIIEELKKIGILNDQKYACAFIADQVHLSSLGPNQIRKKLLDHNIPIEQIEEELNKYDSSLFQEKLEKLLQKKIKNNHKHSNYQLKQKLISEYMNQGYEKEMIGSLLEQFLQNDSSILEREYQIWYRKLSRKYEGQELTYQIKNKLYQKGFSASDIARCLENIE